MHYPDQRYMTDIIRFTRSVQLPEGALGQVLKPEGTRVDVRDVVVRGYLPNTHIIINAAEELRLRNVKNLKKFLLVKPRQRVNEGDAIVGKDPKRGRRVFAPANGMVVYVGDDDGIVLFQELPEMLNLDAGSKGDIVAIQPGRGVQIETTGTLIQGVWGNGRSFISTMRMEPYNGITSLSLDTLETEYRNEIVVTKNPLTYDVLQMAEARQFGGLIAPSVNANLMDYLMSIDRAVMLTEGFGDMRMGSTMGKMFEEYDSFQATLDAYNAGSLDPRRPELIVNRIPNEPPPEPNFRLALKRGMRIRITRAPYTGRFGKVVRIFDQPQIIGNDLRVMCALVELSSGDAMMIPIANLEIVTT